jgi:signal transduction histidine kinase
MGSRGRSIRLRIYFLVAIPLVAMVGLLAYVAGTSINNAISLDRAPNLVNATALPAANFGVYVQDERTAAVVYLFHPTAANLQTYQSAIAATDRAKVAFTSAMSSQATMGTETASGVKAIKGVEADLSQLTTLRNAVKARILSPLDALTFYSQGMSAEASLFLVQTESVVVTDQLPQAIGLIATVQAREQLSQEDALLSGMLAAKRITTKDRIAFTHMAATRQADAQYADFILSPANLATYNAALAGSGTMQQDLAGIEQAIAGGTPVARLPVTPAGWQHLAGTLLQDEYNGGVAVVSAVLAADHKISHAAWVRVAVVSGIALLGLLITILVTTLVARGIIRRLGGLERNALQLAEVQLPDVVGRLRRGEDVDVNAEAPALRAGADEIGRVGQAFDLVRQTAIRAAVEEARLRRGLNDVFRSLARRSQSLLHRQLTLLDQMERRATDPEALDDLFRLDHLTTRMRRHAEGLVILAGGPPGRAWSSPVRMVDVMRGAIAEVEDYARVSVATRSQAALAGSAVADVIHLLAELIENATTLSPPYTSVRVSGDTVASGFAIEVEDRGLGMSPERLAELNELMASPPEFNPSDSEQLGLFVVSQLAKRHGIRVTLKASPYGGTAAIVLIPQHLVVTEDAFRAGLPGEPTAIGMAARAVNGNHAAPDTAGSVALREVPMPGRMTGPGGTAGPPGFDVFRPRRRVPGTAETLVPAEAGPEQGPGSAPVPFPGWTPGSGGPGPVRPATSMVPVASPRADQVPGPPWELSRQTGPLPALPADAGPGSHRAGAGPDGDAKGLPRRVKQANLAPQLRADPPRRRHTVAAAGPAGGPTPAEIRQTMSALQRGWQEGRSQRTAGPAPSEPWPESPGGSREPAADEAGRPPDGTLCRRGRPRRSARLAARRPGATGHGDHQGRHPVTGRPDDRRVGNARARRRRTPGRAGRRIPVTGPRGRAAFRRRHRPADHHRDGIRIPARDRRRERNVPRGHHRAGRRSRPGRIRDGRHGQAVRRAHPGQHARVRGQRLGLRDAMPSSDERWLDAEAGPVVRPYALTQGRTRHAGESFDLMASVVATRAIADLASLAPEHIGVLRLARAPTTVADIASDVDLPLGVVRIILADLRELGLIAIRTPVVMAERIDKHTLREVLNGLRSL